MRPLPPPPSISRYATMKPVGVAAIVGALTAVLAPAGFSSGPAPMSSSEQLAPTLGSALSFAGTHCAAWHVVPAGHWQAARSRGPYALTGCTVGPGFDFADFSFLRDVPEALARVRQADAALADLA